MNLSSLRPIVAFGLIAFASGCGKPEPCQAIPGSDASDALGVVLDGGRLCKDGSGVFNIDYEKPVEEVQAAYLSELKDKGWKGEKVSEGRNGGSLFFDNGEQKMLVTVLKSERKVTVAIIKHCMVKGADPNHPVIKECLETTQKMADIMKEKK